MVGQRSRYPAGSRESGPGRVGRIPGPGSQAYNGQSAWLIMGIQHMPYGTRWTSGATHARHWPRGVLGPRLAVQRPWCHSGHLGEVSCRYLQASDSEWPLGCGHGGSCQGLQRSRDRRPKPGPQGRQPHGPALGPGGPVHLGTWLGALAPAVYKPWPHSTEFQMGGRCRRAQGLLGPQSQPSCRGTTRPLPAAARSAPGLELGPCDPVILEFRDGLL